MNRHLSLTVLSTLSLMAAGAVGVSTAATAATAPPAGETAIVNCAGKVVTKPHTIAITCADGGVSVNKITWSTWTSNDATGKGALAWNTCLPKTCVAGIAVKYPVTIALGGLASGPNLTVFSKMTVAFPKGGPASLETGTYTLDNPTH